MTPALVRRALRRSLGSIRHVAPVRPGAGSGPVDTVYAQVERDFGMLAPPVALHAPAPDVLAACWMMLRETLVAQGAVSRAAKEVVAAAVSERNTCPYCVEVHSSAVGGLGTPPGSAELARWAAAGDDRADRTTVTAAQRPELLGVAVTFEYLNRMVNVFLGDSPLPPSAPATAHRPASWLFGRLARGAVAAEPGASLGLLPQPARPDTVLHADLSWAMGNEAIAGAFVRASAAIAAAGRRSVPPEVRDVVHAELAGWAGEQPGLGRTWVERPVAGVPAAVRPAARLALLTALASYQVDQAVIEDFRRDRSDDQALVEFTAWASFAAARHVAQRYAQGVTTQTSAAKRTPST